MKEKYDFKNCEICGKLIYPTREHQCPPCWNVSCSNIEADGEDLYESSAADAAIALVKDADECHCSSNADDYEIVEVIDQKGDTRTFKVYRTPCFYYSVDEL